MAATTLTGVEPLGFHWRTRNPFLFCAHHKDHYPPGNGEAGPAASLEGRSPGHDFTLRDGWRMYHGEKVPGFPVHPHRGFETVTLVLEGFVDHSDSHGAAGRYGNGDVQWMTAGSGLQHAEMFPLLRTGESNPLELFQVWLNLPRARKFADPCYKMLWAGEIPVIGPAEGTEVRLVAGQLSGVAAPAPAPDSWAADPDHEVAIWLAVMKPGAEWQLPAASPAAARTLYYFEGSGLEIDRTVLPPYHLATLEPGNASRICNGDRTARFLLLQGVPIDEPVVQYGPFVMNSEEEIRQAFRDYRRTQFGGWPWERPDPVHGPDMKKFARYAGDLPGEGH